MLLPPIMHCRAIPKSGVLGSIIGTQKGSDMVAVPGTFQFL